MFPNISVIVVVFDLLQMLQELIQLKAETKKNSAIEESLNVENTTLQATISVLRKDQKTLESKMSATLSDLADAKRDLKSRDEVLHKNLLLTLYSYVFLFPFDGCFTNIGHCFSSDINTQFRLHYFLASSLTHCPPLP